MGAPVITAITNDKDGSHVTVTLAEAPTGPISFAARLGWDGVAAVVAHVALSATQYRVTIPTGVEGRVETLWWVTAADTLGTSAAASVWVQFGTDDPLDVQIQTKLREILDRHKAPINSRLLPYARTGRPLEVAQVLSGLKEAVTDQLTLSVIVPQFRVERFAVPHTNIESRVARIDAFLLSNDAKSLLLEMQAVAGAVKAILNTSTYREIPLPCGVSLSRCQVGEGEVHEGRVQRGQSTYFATEANLTWTCELPWAVA